MIPADFAKKMKRWCDQGFKELGDIGGMGIGRTTHTVLREPCFLKYPHMVRLQSLIEISHKRGETRGS